MRTVCSVLPGRCHQRLWPQGGDRRRRLCGVQLLPAQLERVLYLDPDTLIINPIRPLVEDIDKFGHPPVNGKDMYLITNNKLTPGDPQVHSTFANGNPTLIK